MAHFSESTLSNRLGAEESSKEERRGFPQWMMFFPIPGFHSAPTLSAFTDLRAAQQ
jgi:hypothetical protein